ncbi:MULTISPECIES: bifunctional diguanylate cyclase/phosphodiesterase [unclassified Actinoplanes]|uniref:putative bifunctional diguanylate cyclase/phosphodiesterase n=1 Tax=unclassified Actinoplanes TaxID=2626549 RepID=UPI0012BAA610|nr:MULTISPECIES: EAL domain-containing protein [unclassified Actinoplanes]
MARTGNFSDLMRVVVEGVAQAVPADAVAVVERGRVVAMVGSDEPDRVLRVASGGGTADDGVVVPVARVAPDATAWTGEMTLVLTGRGLGSDEIAVAEAVAAALGVCLSGRRRHDNDSPPAGAADAEGQAARLLERLSVVQRAIARQAPLDEIFRTVTAQTQALLGDDIVALALRDGDDPERLHLVAAYGFPDDVLHRLWSTPVAAGGVTGQAVLRGELVVFDRYADSAHALREGVEAGVHTAMAAPVIHDARVLGSLFVASRKPERSYGPADQNILTAFAGHIGVAIQSARAVDGLQHAFRDPLTGLASRALLLNRLAHSLAHAHRGGGRIAVLLIDLHRFRAVNDAVGHAMGDAILIGAAARLRDLVRGTDTVARCGGDEFAVLLHGAEHVAQASAFARRVMAAMARPFTDGSDGEVTVGCHVGIAFSGPGADSAETLLQGADLALIAAKQRSMGTYEIFQPAMQAALRVRTRIEADLRYAVERGELEVHFQPIVDLRDARIAGCEALVRWRHPQRGMVSPLDFISLAEQNGAITAIGRWVLRQACRQTAQWNRRRPHAPLYVAVNLSGRQLEQSSLADDVVQVLRETGLESNRLVLELTESVLVADAPATLAQLRRFKELGVRLAVDDFGTGYSSLAYLRRFPIDILKIDKSFVDDIATAPASAALAEGIVHLAHTMGLATVAEGVEDARQREVLLNSGCEFAQGYHFAKPLTATECGEHLFGEQPSGSERPQPGSRAAARR